MATPPQPLASRVRGLMGVKGLQYNDIAAFDANAISKKMSGHLKVTVEDLRLLANALECTSDYLIGLGEDYRSGGEYDDYAFAAAKMAFTESFERDPSIPAEMKTRCRKVFADDELLLSEGAPRTAEAWRTLARMIEKASPPAPPASIRRPKGA